MKEVIVAHLTCEICNDTWFRDMSDRELDGYIDEHPEANFRMITDPNDGTYVDLEGIICDGCEDFMKMNTPLNSRKKRRSRRNTLKNSKRMLVPRQAPVSSLFGTSTLNLEQRNKEEPSAIGCHRLQEEPLTDN